MTELLLVGLFCSGAAYFLALRRKDAEASLTHMAAIILWFYFLTK